MGRYVVPVMLQQKLVTCPISCGADRGSGSYLKNLLYNRSILRYFSDISFIMQLPFSYGHGISFPVLPQPLPLMFVQQAFQKLLHLWIHQPLQAEVHI